MSTSFRGGLLAAIFSVGVAGAVVAPARAETLADALALAYDSNPNLLAQRASQRVLDETYVQARTGWRPTLNASASATFEEIRRPRGSFNPLLSRSLERANVGTATLTLTQPLWTGGRTASAVSATNADVLQGRENLRRLEAQVMQAVIQAYADTRRDTTSLAIQQENVAVLRRQLEESQARFDVGEITRTDVALSEARLAASKAQLQTAIAQLAISRAAYAAAVGQNPGDLTPEPSLAYLLPGNVDDVFEVAEQNNPTLRGQQYAEQASRARVAGARAERMPTVSLQGTLRFGNAPVEPFTRRLYDREAIAAVGVNVPLFNGGLTSSRIRQSIERNNTDRITVETQRRSVLQTVTQAWSQLMASRANILSTAEQVRAARIAEEGTRQEQQVGLRTTLDVLNAEQELRSAELAQVGARREEYVASALVLSTMGRLEAKNLIPTVSQYDAKANFRRLRVTWGWVPWEEAIGIVDRAVAFPLIPQPKSLPVEPPIGPGLQPPPATTVTARP